MSTPTTPHVHIDLSDLMMVCQRSTMFQPALIWTTLGALRTTRGLEMCYVDFLLANSERDDDTCVVLDSLGIRVEEVN